MLDCERVDEVKEETLIVVKVLRGKGTKEDMCRHVHMYYQYLLHNLTNLNNKCCGHQTYK